MGEEIMHRHPKRYTVARSGDGYEVQDADAKGARVFFSDSQKAARKMSKQLNNTQRTQEMPDRYASGGGAGDAGGGMG
jgi:hypothetical protein